MLGGFTIALLFWGRQRLHWNLITMLSRKIPPAYFKKSVLACDTSQNLQVVDMREEREKEN